MVRRVKRIQNQTLNKASQNNDAKSYCVLHRIKRRIIRVKCCFNSRCFVKILFNRYSPFSKALFTLLTKIIFNAMRFVNTDHQIRTTAVNRQQKRNSLSTVSLGSGSCLSSHAVASTVLSVYEGLTSVFGMRTGGTPQLNHRKGDWFL